MNTAPAPRLEVPIARPTEADVRQAARTIYGLAAQASDGGVHVDRCRPVSPTSRRCRIRITGDAPFAVSLRVRQTPAGRLICVATASSIGHKEGTR